MKKIMKRFLSISMCVMLILGSVGCGNRAEKMKAEYEGVLPISDILQPMFEKDTMMNETVMFIDYGEAKELLYTPDEILAVTSYDGKITYKEGVDYEFRDGKLIILEGSSMPCITSEKYYNVEESIISVYEEGQGWVPIYWGEEDSMTKYQVCVDYTHSETWEGYEQRSYPDRYEELLKKLQKGKDVTVYFYGDSITEGSNASFYMGIEPYQYTYPVLFLQALAEIFNYTITFVNPANKANLPEDDLVYGKRGTITCINSAVGGWSVSTGLNSFDEAVKPNIEKYGCDLFVAAFGMNDGEFAASAVADCHGDILNKVLELAPDASLMLVSTMVPHPDTSRYFDQDEQESFMLEVAERFHDNGNPCAVACMTSTSLSVLEHKDFVDITGNNVNHPNDFLSRIYAQTLLQTLIGYENMWDMVRKD